MKTYRNARFTKRDYECTNIVAIVAEKLPIRFQGGDWVEADASATKGLTFLGAEYSNGERFELYGYL